METGYVLFNLKPGCKKDFLEKIRKVKAVKEARLVIGIFDAIAKIETESIEELERIYLNDIEMIESITNSRLHFVACPRTRK
ncbi:MAG: Lrp/AsnC ligand binding domain-containing protein [Candidatus Brockarchaeota archaeon]|nr:Lrp/AsnC ligand binding domain-containing protein [Candidatus Brockarchaeota archaeon]